MNEDKDEFLKLLENDCEDVMQEILKSTVTKDEQIEQIKYYQKELARMIDEECKTIDCVDFLIYEMEKKERR